MISTLIPAYKAEYILENLRSLNNQTFKNFHVVVSDDSPNNIIHDIIKPYIDKKYFNYPIKIVEGKKIGPTINARELLARTDLQGEFIHLFLDDDVIATNFYENHISAHKRTFFSASVSKRLLGDKNLKNLIKPSLPPEIAFSEAPFLNINSNTLFKTSFESMNNWLGESSFCLFRRDFIEMSMPCKLFEIPYHSLNDLGFLLILSMQADICFINQDLGIYRLNALQISGDRNSFFYKSAILSWIALSIDAFHLRKIRKENLYQCIEKILQTLSQEFPNDKEILPFIQMMTTNKPYESDEFKLKFTSVWLSRLAKNRDSEFLS